MEKLVIDFLSDVGDNNEYRFCIKECAVEHCHPQKVPESGIRDYYALHIVIFGNGYVERDGVQYTVGKGEFFITRKNEHFNYYPNTKDPWSYYYVDFYADNFEKLFGCQKNSPTILTCKIKSFDKVVDMCRELIDVFDVYSGQSMYCIGMFLALLSLLINDYRDSENNQDGIKQNKSKQFQSILMYINNNYRLDLTMSDIACAVGLSESYITSIFAQEIQMSPMRYLNNFRIATACGLIKESSLSVSEIASAVGFKDRLYFSRVFSKIKGMSPRQYRKVCADDDPFAFIKEKNLRFRYGF